MLPKLNLSLILNTYISKLYKVYFKIEKKNLSLKE